MSKSPKPKDNQLKPTVKNISDIIPRQLDQEKITILEKRVHDLTVANNEYRDNSLKSESDTHDIVLYFQRELDIKDEIISRLNEEIIKRDNQLKSEIDKIKRTFEEEVKTAKSANEYIINDLRAKYEAAQVDLQSVEIYRQERDQYEGRLQKLEKDIQEKRQQMFDALDDQERKFLEEKSQLLKTLDDQKLVFREIALKEARLAMGEEAKKILNDNTRMHEELKFHNNATVELQAEKGALTNLISSLKRDIEILNEKELEYAKRLHSKSKETKSLREKVEQLEYQISMKNEKFKHKAYDLKVEVNKELEEASIDIIGLRRLLGIKNRELRHMKALSTTILRQRSETEQFFLEALEEVKESIRHGKKVKSRLEGKKLFEETKAGHLLPNITNGDRFNAVQINDVNIEDLSWEDKELVLRILFCKINGKDVISQKKQSDREPLGSPSSTER